MWVDGVVRVVCGLSEETSCQDVVIALAQAIGMFIRYTQSSSWCIKSLNSSPILKTSNIERLL